MAHDDDGRHAFVGYVLSQLTRALEGAGARAAERAAQWRTVLVGLADGVLTPGSRTPVAGMPAWVTPEVIHGGFTTGKLAANGPLQPHETEWLAAHLPGGTRGRASLNLHFLSDTGRAQLATMLANGTFRIHVPEEGALLVATWLIAHGEADRAARLIAAVSPLFPHLRFYPVPHDRPVRASAGVCVQPVAKSVQDLQATKPKMAILRMKEAIEVWSPLYDRAVALFAETVAGELPAFQRNASGDLVRANNGQPVVGGGWPCRQYAPDWDDRARELLEACQQARATHRLCSKPQRPKENLARLRGYLAVAVKDRAALTGRDVGTIRKVIASYVARHGRPGSAAWQHAREAQARNAALPSFAQCAKLVAQRLQRHPLDQGVPEPMLADDLAPVRAAESSTTGIPTGMAIPERVQAKARRCLEADLATLADKGLVRSGETLALLAPGITAQVQGRAIADPQLRCIFEGVYRAFRQRRSLLLLNLEAQVGLRDLPWIDQVEPWIEPGKASQTAAQETLKQVAGLALRMFPHTIVSNNMVKELRALGGAAGLFLPWVSELAADIFMGAFSASFLQAAKTAAHLLQGSIYERYYGVPYARILNLNDVTKKHSGAASSPGFHAFCTELAGAHPEDRWSVARNGMIIEQAQIATTHNLATLFDRFEFAQSLPLADLSQSNLAWVLRHLQRNTPSWRSQMRGVKNAAYAWRQMIFFLSFVEPKEVQEFVAWSTSLLEQQRQPFRMRFAPALAGLHAVVAGRSFDANGMHAPSGGRRFVAWSQRRHWLLPPRADAGKHGGLA